jgi:hypothetical protein
VGELAALAQSYIGRLPYVFAGVPARGRVDCSSFLNLLRGWKQGKAIPGWRPGTYHGQVHGPVVIQWATFPAATTVTGPPEPDDLCIWPGIGALGHIGVAVSATRMVSALNPQLGIIETPIKGYGPRGVPLIFRRLADSGGGVSPAGAAAAGCVPQLLLLPFLLATRRPAPGDRDD